jgi:hypothetical protein
MNTSLKEEADRLMQIKGNSRGEILRTHAVYIFYRKGEEGVRLVEKKMEEIGYPLRFKGIRPLTWYPEALSVLVILVAKEIFKWEDSDIFDMGNSAPKYSFIVKLLMKYFLSPKRSFEESPKYWRAYFDFGTSEAAEFNEKEKYLVVRVKGYKFHPLVCIYHSGYFLRIAQFVIKSKRIAIKEIKCAHQGDPYHEYLISW